MSDDELLSRGVDQIIGRTELEDAFKSGRKLRIKFGVDPTRPDIHIGHAVLLRQLRELQRRGHTVIFLIGDYTTKIGDPSGRSKTRPMLTDDEIAANAKTYLDQVGQILDVKNVEIRRNSEWLSKLSFADLLSLASNLSVAQIIEREDFKNRLATGQELSLHEFLYPLMQAYDSVVLEADVEFGGTDQLFNLVTGRNLQKKLGQRPQIVFCTELLVGTDGVKKMSKSLDNYIAITDEPLDMYGKVMSIPDNLIAPYYKLCTEIELVVIDELVKTLAAGANPRDAKASLAREIVRIYHGPASSEKAEADWNNQFRDGGRPETIETITVDPTADFLDILVTTGMASSKSDARRLIDQGGVKLDDHVVEFSNEAVITDGQILQVGKRRYLKLHVT
ncbi:tyrosine--tRNA ligase [Candidatus Saccharibacteria bacterium]|nr:tyrosine--tRNA ligase [Candidatus Saccharibacteria bacterium]